VNQIQVESIIEITARVVCAFVSFNSVPAAEVPNLIRTIHATLVGLVGGGVGSTRNASKPAVPIGKSITPDFIVCLEDGKRLKMLKRYLRSRHGLSPEAYRAKWGLPLDYPMTAPSYAALRSKLAKQIGLGRISRKARKRARA
jgi:predicted transcriptional regulator